MIFLDRIDSVPLAADEFSFEFRAWATVLVDSLNSIVAAIEPLVLLPAIITGTTQTADLNTSYIIGNAAQTTVALPDTAPVNSVVQIVGLGAGGWVLTPGLGQTIKLAASSAATSITSAERYDVITVKCVVEDLTWVTLSYVSTGLVIV